MAVAIGPINPEIRLAQMLGDDYLAQVTPTAPAASPPAGSVGESPYVGNVFDDILARAIESMNAVSDSERYANQMIEGYMSGDVELFDLIVLINNWFDGVYPSSDYIDDFNDNTMGSIWTLMAPSEPNFWLDETNQRLEVRSTGIVDDGAVYAPNGWYLDTSQNFGLKIRFYNEVESVTWSELLLALGEPSDIFDNHLQFSVCCLDLWGHTGPHFYYELMQEGIEVEELYIQRVLDDGWIYVSYDTVLDELYFGINGYGPNNAFKTVSGLLKGDWAGKHIGPHIGGSSDHVEILSGKAYWDDLIIDYGKIITE